MKLAVVLLVVGSAVFIAGVALFSARVGMMVAGLILLAWGFAHIEIGGGEPHA